MTGNFSNAGTITATASASGIACLRDGRFHQPARDADRRHRQFGHDHRYRDRLRPRRPWRLRNTIVTPPMGATTYRPSLPAGSAIPAACRQSRRRPAVLRPRWVRASAAIRRQRPVAFNGGFNNAGLISATAVGAGTGYARGNAASIYLYGTGSAVLSGGITNCGPIISTGTGTGSGFVQASGLLVDVTRFSFGQTAAINGNVVNSGFISATATSAQNGAVATAADAAGLSAQRQFHE